MSDENRTLTPEEIAFKARYQKDWEVIRQFWKGPPKGKEDPQYRLATEYFQVYLDRRPSALAAQALNQAFTMWSNLEGVSERVRDAIKLIPYDEDVWDKVGHGLVNAFSRDDHREECFELLEELVQKVVPLKSRATLLHTLARRWMQKGDLEKARQGFEQILKWDLSGCDWNIEHDAKGCLYEIEHLNTGQLAPHFSAHDIDGRIVDLKDYRGCIVLLDFWASWCGPCYGEFPHLRNIASRYSGGRFFLIGISLDEDLTELRKCVEKEKLEWPHICEGKCWHDPLAKLFNIVGIPQTYILDQSGYIAFKGKRDKELEESLASLLN